MALSLRHYGNEHWLVSRMLNVNSHELERAKMRATQEFTGEKFADDTTWEGHYDEK